MERDKIVNGVVRRKFISTHTLTWSVTCRSWRNVDEAEHFNSHAHVERDQQRKNRHACYHDFNSHAHVERDTQENVPQNIETISTHTLTWSVTTMLYDF